MEKLHNAYRAGQKIEIQLPARPSPESLFLLIDVLEQLFNQLFHHHDEEIASALMRLYNNAIDEPPDTDLDQFELPF